MANCNGKCISILLFALTYNTYVSCLPYPEQELANLGIVGGKDARQADFSYQVSLELYGSHQCGGTLVLPNIVITAAHCTKGSHYTHFRVRAGTQQRGGSNGTLVQVAKIVEHPDFSFETVHSDIAIIKLNKFLPFSKTINPIPYAELDEIPLANSKANVSGWGDTQEGGYLADRLQYATITVFDKEYCSNHIDVFTDGMICAGIKEGGIDACQADSGGPLVANNKLIGVVSFGDGCGRADSPGVYTSTAYFHSWIDRTIKRLNNVKDF